MPIQCNICAGWGLVKQKKLFSCTKCDSSCCFCENKKYKGYYVECEICAGSGEIPSNKPLNCHKVSKKKYKTK